MQVNVNIDIEHVAQLAADRAAELFAGKIQQMIQQAKPSEYLTLTDAAAYLQLSTKTLSAAIKRGEIKTVKICDSVRIKRSTLESLGE